jgi:hypothetical protein
MFGRKRMRAEIERLTAELAEARSRLAHHERVAAATRLAWSEYRLPQPTGDPVEDARQRRNARNRAIFYLGHKAKSRPKPVIEEGVTVGYRYDIWVRPLEEEDGL